VSNEREKVIRPGAAVDASGGPTVDPTENVKALVLAEKERQNDLRLLERRLAEAQANHLEQIAELRAKHAEDMQQGQRDLAAAESRRIDANMLAESRRIDALLAAQQNSVALATARAELTAASLAERVDTSAKALATAGEASAKSFAAVLESAIRSLSERIVPLEQRSYEGKGKETIADPAMIEFRSEMKAMLAAKDAEIRTLTAANNTRTGFDAGRLAAVGGGVIGGGAGLIYLITQMMKH
jgi:hypothetical protein